MKSRHWQGLAAPPINFLATLERVDDAIDENADIASEILAHGLSAFGLNSQPQGQSLDWRGTATPEDLSKARTTINQIYRDWSAEGLAERNVCNGPVLDDIDKIFGHVSDKARVRILVPGAGLARLVFDLCRKGFTTEGNEVSYHQLIASSWMLNHTQRSRQFKLYPFVCNFNNIVSREHQLQAVEVPDVHPSTELEQTDGTRLSAVGDRMTMSASEFVIHYGDGAHHEVFDAVVTVFFIDTAPNVLRYIEVVRSCLKKGGAWINIGPLLWHFGDRASRDTPGISESSMSGIETGIEEAGSVELTVEEVLLLIEQMGFAIEKHEIRDGGAGYIQNPESLLLNVYRLSHWIARKL
ncbi:MAG: hypothetical protein HETSPECPRED_005900 [Heterodermia speciosa]|uniref:carnosine N-methyltransferase n=1 Tax=Heterodermia speciosa TaxID=116794 RepID=A0A8H3FJB3_9LECA|nr:MAG: hypothetical protein HETSPECPRED_005900 [Heterodermia speciosa]